MKKNLKYLLVGSVTVTVLPLSAASAELCSSKSKASIRVKNLQRFIRHSF